MLGSRRRFGIVSESALSRGEKAILLVFCLRNMARLQAGEKGGIEHMGVPDINTQHALI